MLVSLPDVAGLAGVQRPVVSVWRSRSAGTSSPFPPRRAGDDRRPLFELADVVDWLVATGLGTNPDVVQDAAAFACLDPLAEGPAALDALTALLALKGAAGVSVGGLSRADLLDLADELDPHDGCLFREVEAIDDVPRWTAHADAMASAAYSATAAVELVLARRHRLGLAEHARTHLSPWALDVVATLAAELGRLDDGPSAIVDPWGADDLLLAVLAERHGLTDRPALSAPTTSAATRLGRRRLLAHGLFVDDGPGDGSSPPAGSLTVGQLPCPGRQDPSDDEVLAALDDVAVGLGPTDRAVVIGPGSALAAAVSSRRAADRARTLRTGRVHALVRLGRLLRSTRPREDVVIWVLGPERAEVAVGERSILLADLSAAARTDPGLLQDLAVDVASVCAGAQGEHGHVVRTGRLARTADLVASSGDLFGARPVRARPGSRPAPPVAGVVSALVEQVGVPLAADLGVRVVGGPLTQPRLTTVAALADRGAVRVLPGHRIDAEHLGSGGGVPVIGAEEVRGLLPRGGRTVDRLVLAAAFPAARFTEPGDVVVCGSGPAGAVVDRVGYGVVLTPARIVRLRRDVEPGLVPGVVAADLAAAPAGGWRSAPVRLVAADQAQVLDDALASVEVARADVVARLAALGDLSRGLADAVAAGVAALSYAPNIPMQEG